VIKVISVSHYLKELKANKLSENTLTSYAEVLNKLNDFKPGDINPAQSFVIGKPFMYIAQTRIFDLSSTNRS